MGPASDDAFDAASDAAQRAYWRDADAGHYRWQTEAPYVAESEAALLDGVTLATGARLLEVGCGEGGNLLHLSRRHVGARLFGTDFSSTKAAFAALATGARTVRADARALPFADGSFDAVLVRDLLHHLSAATRAVALAEAHRVLRSDGTLTLIEPNRQNPLVLLQALTVPEERGVLGSHARGLVRELRAAGFAEVRVQRRQPLPVSRVILHPTLGLPSLGALRAVRWALGAFERAAQVLPGPLWAYVVCTATKARAGATSNVRGRA